MQSTPSVFIPIPTHQWKCSISGPLEKSKHPTFAMFYRRILFLISCVVKFQVQFALQPDIYLNLLATYSTYNYVRAWTHFVCYQHRKNFSIQLVYYHSITHFNTQFQMKMFESHRNYLQCMAFNRDLLQYLIILTM